MAYALVLIAALAGEPQPAPQSAQAPWRLVDRPDLHVGVRGHAELSGGEVGLAVTVQVTASWLTW